MKSGSFIQFRIIFLLIFLVGAYTRFTYVNWDSFGAFHPDERNISWAVTRIRFFSQMNPKFFAYGGLPIYLYRALDEGVVRVTGDPQWLYDWGHIAVVGRYVSAVLSTVSIGLIFLVGSAYFSPATGILSAAFLAFSPWAIQQAHFETTETMLVFFILLMLYTSRRLIAAGSVDNSEMSAEGARASARDRTARKIGNATSAAINVLWVGAIWGLALAAKTTSLVFGVIPLAAIWFPHIFKNFGRKLFLTFLLVGVTIIFFFAFSPYTLLDLQHFSESMTYESGVALGRFTVPYTLQFLHTVPYLYQLTTMLWQAGPLVIVGLAGLLLLLIRFLFTKRYSLFTFIVFPLLYFAWVGTWFAKFARYNVPFLPFVTISAAWFMVFTLRKIPGRSMYWFMCLFAYSIICVLSLAWGLANYSVYLRPQTKRVATEWIAQHIPSDAKIYTEHWNDGLPLDLPGIPSYKRELLNVYDEPDDDSKQQYLADKAATGDYIIFSTRRIWATMPGLTEKYPVTSLFYTKLLSGELGYSEVARFTSFPQLFGIRINDDGAEESLQVFDHPTVRIFQNTGRFPEKEIFDLLNPSH